MKRCVVFALWLIAGAVRAQISGFSPTSETAERHAERELIHAIHPDTLRSIVTAISREVHVAGTPAQARTRDYVVDRWKRAGLSTQVYPYNVYFPLAKSSSLALVTPVKKTFDLHEERFPGEAESKEYPWVNGYSGVGTVSGDVVYVNYGLHEDYHDLDSLGISVKGKIAIVRYGKSYRGIKALLAEEHGAAGLLIFSDPSGDGYDAGDLFPHGPMRPWNGVQRGSIYNGHGDPTTPGYASIPGAWHVSADSSSPTPRIPVIPISYGIANDILSRMHGRDIPNAGWQGGLAFRYHIDAGTEEPVRVTMNVQDDRKQDGGLKPIWDVVGTVPGTTFPNEWVIVGGHRDAWCYGAEDNAAGCASVIAAAEAFAKLAKEGIRPKRSVLFVTWDAEEWGLLGSTEWVEQLEKELGTNAIAYINQDECATGNSFEASADPALRTFVYEAAKAVPDGTGNPIYADWSRRAAPKANGVTPVPAIGLLGGGSDFSPFYNHLGIPSLEHGFGGSFGEYHSNHDNISWTLHFGDSTFRSHAASSQFAAVEAMRLANADILPFDFAAMGTWLDDASEHEKIAAVSQHYDTTIFADLLAATERFTQDGNRFDSLRDRVLQQGDRSFTELNETLRDVERSFTKPDGLFFDRWERNMLVLADPDNGYADVRLPELDLAVRRKNGNRFQTAVHDLTEATRMACAKLEAAMQQLK